MSDYLENLARRASGKQNFLQPRVPSLFEPAFSQELLISSIVPAEDAFRLRSSGQRRREAIETTDLDADVVRSGDMPLTNLPIKLMSTVSKNSAGCLIADTNDEIAPLESDRIEKDPEELAGKSAPIALRDLQHSGENQRGDDNQSDEAKPPAIGKDDGATGLDYGNLHDAPPQKYGVWNSQHTGHLRQMGNPPQSRHHQQTENSEIIFPKLPIRTKVSPSEDALETIDNNKLISTGPKNSAGCLIADANNGIAPLESERIEKDPEELAGKSAPIALRDLQHSGENQRGDDNQSDEAKPPAIGKDDGATGLDYGNLHDAPPQKYGVWNSQHTGHLRQMGNPPQSRHHQQTENSEMIFSKNDKSYLESSVSERSNENGGNMESGTEKRRALGSQLMEPNLMGSFRQNENSVLPGEKLVSSQELMHDIIASSPAFKIEQPKKLQKPIVASQEQSGQIQPSIKVTIGRIEVRAVKPPEKRVERKETNPPSSSLDDYLASLRGRSR